MQNFKQVLTKRLIQQAENASGKPTFLWDAKVSGFGVRISPKNKKTFVVTYRVGRGAQAPKQWHTIGVFESPYGLEAARSEALSVLSKAQSGIDPKAKTRRNNDMTLSQLCDRYESWAEEKLKDSTLRKYREIIRNHIKPNFGSRLISGLGPDDFEPYFMAKAKTTRRTAGLIASVISSIFIFALKKRIIKKNPLRNMDRPKPNDPRERILKPHEVGLIWNSIKEEQAVTKLLFQLIMITGKRETDIGGRRVRDFDAQKGVFRIPRNLGKNNEFDEFPVPTRLLSDLVAITAERDKDEFIFGRLGQTPFSGWSHAKKRISDRIRDKIDFEVEHWTIHDLRRLVTSTAAASGASEKVLKRIINHTIPASDAATKIYNRYAYNVEVGAFYDTWFDQVEQYGADVSSLRRQSGRTAA